MDIVLLVSEDCIPCRNAERLWPALCQEAGAEMRLLGVENAEGEALALRLGIKSLPVLLVDERVVVVGVPEVDEARELLLAALP